MTQLTQPAKTGSRSGQMMWMMSILVGFVVLTYLGTFAFVSVKNSELVEIPWASISSIVGTLLIGGGLPYGVARTTFKHPG